MVIYTSTTDTAARTALHSLPANYANDITINHVAVMNSFNGESDRIKIQRRFRFCFEEETVNQHDCDLSFMWNCHDRVRNETHVHIESES